MVDLGLEQAILEAQGRPFTAEARCRFPTTHEPRISGCPLRHPSQALNSRRLPIWQLYERARSLGLAVQVSAQSWPGLAADEDERYRIAASADGGIWLLRTPHPEPAAAPAGTRGGVTYVQGQAAGGPAGGAVGAGCHPRAAGRRPRGRAAAVTRSPVRASAAARALPRRPARASRCGGAARRGLRDEAIPVIGRRRRAPAADPFGVLGLKPSPDLADSDVRAAWRRAAGATHPDREDGGDPERFAAAAAAYTALRTRSGRREALADLGEALADLGVVPPFRLALRILAAAAASTAAVAAAGPHPAAPALVTGVVTWLVLTARHDLAPPGG